MAQDNASPVKKNALHPFNVIADIYAMQTNKKAINWPVAHIFPNGASGVCADPSAKKSTSNERWFILRGKIPSSEPQRNNKVTKPTLSAPIIIVNSTSLKCIPNINIRGVSRIAGNGGQ